MNIISKENVRSVFGANWKRTTDSNENPLYNLVCKENQSSLLINGLLFSFDNDRKCLTHNEDEVVISIYSKNIPVLPTPNLSVGKYIIVTYSQKTKLGLGKAKAIRYFMKTMGFESTI